MQRRPCTHNIYRIDSRQRTDLRWPGIQIPVHLRVKFGINYDDDRTENMRWVTKMRNTVSLVWWSSDIQHITTGLRKPDESEREKFFVMQLFEGSQFFIAFLHIFNIFVTINLSLTSHSSKNQNYKNTHFNFGTNPSGKNRDQFDVNELKRPKRLRN